MWVEWDELVKLFPEANLEDKVTVEGRINVTSPSPSPVDVEGESPVVAKSDPFVEEDLNDLVGDLGRDPSPRRSNRMRRAQIWARD